MLLALALAAAPVSVEAAFDPAEVAWFAEPGANTIRGNALLRTVGGDVVTCAGLPANLVPVSGYAAERFRLMYGAGAQSGFLAASSRFEFASIDPEYERQTRTIRCDSEGNFTFASLPDGEYFVTALVTWQVPGRWRVMTREGGYLMQRLRVAGGETREIVLTAP